MKNPDAESIAQAREIMLDHFTMLWDTLYSDNECGVTLSTLLLALVGWGPDDLALAFSDRVTLKSHRG